MLLRCTFSPEEQNSVHNEKMNYLDTHIIDHKRKYKHIRETVTKESEVECNRK